MMLTGEEQRDCRPHLFACRELDLERERLPIHRLAARGYRAACTTITRVDVQHAAAEHTHHSGQHNSARQAQGLTACMPECLLACQGGRSGRWSNTDVAPSCRKSAETISWSPKNESSGAGGAGPSGAALGAAATLADEDEMI